MMIITALLVLAVVTIALFLNKSYQQKQRGKDLKSGDIAKLKSYYQKEYPSIPPNNVLHILDVDAEYVKVEFLHFKDGTYHTEKLSRDAISKIRRRAA